MAKEIYSIFYSNHENTRYIVKTIQEPEEVDGKLFDHTKIPVLKIIPGRLTLKQIEAVIETLNTLED